MDNLWITFDNTEVELENVPSIFALQNSKLDHCKCQVFLLDTQSIFKLQKYSKYKLYYYIAIMGRGLHFRTCNWKPRTAHLMFPHVNSKIQNHSKSNISLRYPLRANPLKSTLSSLFTSSKTTTITPKIPLNPWKIKHQPNSVENLIYNNEITIQK